MDTKNPPTETAAAVPSHRWRLIWGLSFAGWLTIWLLNLTQIYLMVHSRGESLPWSKAATLLSGHLIWATFTPVILWFCWRYPLSRDRWRSAIPLNILAAFIVSAAYFVPAQLARLLILRLAGEANTYPGFTLSVFASSFLVALIFYIDPFLVAQVVHYARALKARELGASRLEARLAEAQLQVLRMQLHPHFLFNTLHTISALMHKDVRAADRMLALLGDLLRDSFDKIGAQEVSLKQELGFLERYLEIERTRFRDRLVVETDVDPETLDAEVPNLILQPLVENAIRHGVERRMDAGRIVLSARRAGERLELRVRDDGPGLPPEAELGLRGGVGLANTQARLTQLYGAGQRFDLLNRPEGGLEAVISIPFKLHAPERVKPVPGAAGPRVQPQPAPEGAAVVVASTR